MSLHLQTVSQSTPVGWGSPESSPGVGDSMTGSDENTKESVYKALVSWLLEILVKFHLVVKGKAAVDARGYVIIMLSAKESKRLDNEIANANSQLAEMADKSESLFRQLADKIVESKSEDFAGWNVTHKFRANNDYGVSQLYCYHYYVSPDIKQIFVKSMIR